MQKFTAPFENSETIGCSLGNSLLFLRPLVNCHLAKVDLLDKGQMHALIELKDVDALANEFMDQSNSCDIKPSQSIQFQP